MRFFAALLWLGLAGAAFCQTVTLAVEDPASKVLPTVPPDRTVIAIGDLKITAAQFDQMIDALPENSRPVARGGGRQQFADNVVRILVLALEGKRRKIDETPAFKTQAMFSEASVLAGLTSDDLRKNVKLDDPELRKYYDAHQSEYQRVRVRHILIRMQGSLLPLTTGQKELTESEALAKAQDIRQRLLDGEDFATLAGNESSDTESIASGGDIGFFHRGQRVPSFEEAAFALNVGQISEPVKTPFGYHIIRMEAKESKSFEASRPDLEKKLRPEHAQKAIEELAAKAGAVLDNEFFGIAKK
ncbi:MAG TPA: peptidylprolyl isomerase [Candidatus Acidoferrales bacterium]|nr:peptidylprolyl isomerase [Candidatus Acidoferrales bacterium]